MRDLGTLSGSSSESRSLQLVQGEGFIGVTGTFNGAVVAVQYKDYFGNWNDMADGDNETAPFQYRINSGGAPIDIRCRLKSGTPTGDLLVAGGSSLDWKGGVR